jgi:hypothetical protein
VFESRRRDALAVKRAQGVRLGRPREDLPPVGRSGDFGSFALSGWRSEYELAADVPELHLDNRGE